MALLTKEQIQQADDRPTMEVEVPEWGGTVRLRVWSGPERERVEDLVDNKQSRKQCGRAIVAALSIVDENGRRLFDEGDIQRLAEKSGKALDRVFDAACKFNALGNSEIEELAKN